MEIQILLENNSIDTHYKSKHGLSILIKHQRKSILLDVGPNKYFLENAKKLNLDLAGVELLFLSHAHYDHTGGLNAFFKVNKNAVVYLMDKIASKYYLKGRFFNFPIGLKIKKKFNSRINQIDNDLALNNDIYFLKNSVLEYAKPTFNKSLLKKDNKGVIPDTFDHEGILILEENGELVIFNSCSHNGLLNIIETVETKIPNKKIRAYIGGLHLTNPGTGQHEENEYLDMLIGKLLQKDIVVYTGHCTGKFVIDYLKNGLKDRIQEINTGMKLDI